MNYSIKLNLRRVKYYKTGYNFKNYLKIEF
jgi:hypothetical protein